MAKFINLLPFLCYFLSLFSSLSASGHCSLTRIYFSKAKLQNNENEGQLSNERTNERVQRWDKNIKEKLMKRSSLHILHP
jgi:hypothetical protein